MTVSQLGSLLTVAGLVFFADPASAQNPSPAQAQQMLQTNPALVQQLRQKIMTSGLTPDQVRARLRAEGYPENLLDAYLPGSTGVADSTATTEDVFNAIGQLGIADTTEIDLLRCGITDDDLIGARHPSDRTRRRYPGQPPAPRRATEGVRSRCAAQEDSLTRGLKNGPAVDSGFVIFGLDFFRNRSTTFNANLAGPVDANYKINPGDQLALILTGDVEQSYQLDVTREGFVIIPQVGQDLGEQPHDGGARERSLFATGAESIRECVVARVPRRIFTSPRRDWEATRSSSPVMSFAPAATGSPAPRRRSRLYTPRSDRPTTGV